MCDSPELPFPRVLRLEARGSTADSKHAMTEMQRRTDKSTITASFNMLLSVTDRSSEQKSHKVVEKLSHAGKSIVI